MKIQLLIRMKFNMKLTKDEIIVLENYLFRKLINLENSNLTEAKCYKILYSIRQKLLKEIKK